jgi:hypothetical protein
MERLRVFAPELTLTTLTNSWNQERVTPAARAMASRLSRWASRRRTREHFPSLTGPFRWSATKRLPQGRQRKVGVPTVLGQLWTTRAVPQRGQDCIAVGTRVVAFISSAYGYGAWKATTNEQMRPISIIRSHRYDRTAWTEGRTFCISTTFILAALLTFCLGVDIVVASDSEVPNDLG